MKHTFILISLFLFLFAVSCSPPVFLQDQSYEPRYTRVVDNDYYPYYPIYHRVYENVRESIGIITGTGVTRGGVAKSATANGLPTYIGLIQVMGKGIIMVIRMEQDITIQKGIIHIDLTGRNSKGVLNVN